MLRTLRLIPRANQQIDNSLLQSTNLSRQQCRNTWILKRMLPMEMSRKNSGQAVLKKNAFYYEPIVNTSVIPRKKIDVILTQFVEQYGEKGTRISLQSNTAYKRLLLPKLAVYATPENIKKYVVEGEVQKTYSSIHVPFMLLHLKRLVLLVNMSLENPWVLEPWHIRLNFQRSGVHVTSDSIIMPEKPISGPNLDIENKEFYVTVIINNTEKAKVRCRIHHFSLDKDKEPPILPNYWECSAEPLFPEDKEILDTLRAAVVSPKSGDPKCLGKSRSSSVPH